MKIKSFSRVHVLLKTGNKAVSRGGRAATAKKCTKNVLPVQSCCSLRPRPNEELFMRQTKLGELSSRKVSRLAQLSSSE